MPATIRWPSVIAANTHPDHDTLAHFRKSKLAELEELFVQVLLLAQSMKLVRLDQIALDGSKIKANASKHKALSYGHIEKIEAQLREEVQALLTKAETTDREGLADGVDLPAEVARREERLKALAEAKSKLNERADARFKQEQQSYEEKLAGREAKRHAGQKRQGKDPQPPEAGPRNKDQINWIDADSRIMPTANGFVQGYNAQAAVDTETMLVMATTVSQQTNDKQQVEPMLEELQALPEAMGKVETLLADNGYLNASNVKICVKQQIEPLIALGREARHLPLEERLQPDTPAPETGDPVVQMVWRLKTKAGRKCYGQRKCTVEPVFGIIKHVMGFRQFSLRGLDAVAGEWKLVTLAFNMKRMHVLSYA